MKTRHKHWAVLTASTLGLTGFTSAASAGSEYYTYDASGNLIEKSIDGFVTKMTYGLSNRLVEKIPIAGPIERTDYDAAGRPIALKDETGQQTRSINYGYGDKALGVVNQGENYIFSYNAEGRLVGRIGKGKVSTFTWENNVLAADGDIAFTNEDHFTGGVPSLVSNGNITVHDYLGNTILSGGFQVAGTAYGEGLEGERFTGKPFVKELGGFVFLNRIYNLQQCAWSSGDPLGFPDGINNRTYVNNDPLNGVDPLGTVAYLLKEEGSVASHAAFNKSGTAGGSPPPPTVNFTPGGNAWINGNVGLLNLYINTNRGSGTSNVKAGSYQQVTVNQTNGQVLRSAASTPSNSYYNGDGYASVGIRSNYVYTDGNTKVTFTNTGGGAVTDTLVNSATAGAVLNEAGKTQIVVGFTGGSNSEAIDWGTKAFYTVEQ